MLFVSTLVYNLLSVDTTWWWWHENTFLYREAEVMRRWKISGRKS